MPWSLRSDPPYEPAPHGTRRCRSWCGMPPNPPLPNGFRTSCGPKGVYAISGGKRKELEVKLAGDIAREDNRQTQVGSTPTSKAERKSVKKPPKIEIEKFDTDKTDDSPSLNEFFFQRVPDKPRQKDRVVLIAYYIQHIKKLPSFSEGNIDYGYKILGITDRPAHIYQMLIDNKNALGWFEKASDGKNWTLMRPGEIFVEKLPVQQD
jgi:hypothetical protein